MQTATFAGGCFWCTEAVFQRLKGVTSVQSGYSGGYTKNPTYLHIEEDTTGHAEAVQITFDPSIISYETLLEVFWHTHDPTTKDQQGFDRGSQYRSIIFYHSPEQKRVAETSKRNLDASGVYKRPVVTEIVPFEMFYPAEAYHHNYYNKYKNQPYCRLIIDPKIKKLYKEFGDQVKAP